MDKNTSLVSIIIPTFNRADLLALPINSIKKQTHKNIECLIIDDGSTDNTKEIIEQVISEDKRFFYYYKENGGLSSARNYGLDRARGEYIQFLDSDDFINEEKLHISLSFSKADLIICDYYMVQLLNNHIENSEKWSNGLPINVNEGPLSLNKLILDWETRLSIPPHCFLFRSSLFKEIRFNENLKNHEDWECWVKIFLKKPKIELLNKKLAMYTYGAANKLTGEYSKMEEGFRDAIMSLIKQNEQNYDVVDLLLAKMRELDCRRLEANYFQSTKHPSMMKILELGLRWLRNRLR